ncbi:LysM peptidoglycan-binding domain-containing protein [Deinococcus depolymerans]|uniref:C40 family peptidase n=1 Tax=Deinococcus depolymerans TaxID=392408 RepID=A0ABN1BXZ6_9DEIO
MSLSADRLIRIPSVPSTLRKSAARPAAFPVPARWRGPLALLALAALLGGGPAAAQGSEPVAGLQAGDLRGVGSVTVQPGDTAFSLARRAGLSVEALLALNGLTRPDLRAGQVLTLTAAPRTHAVQAGETLYALSRRYGVTVDALLAANALPGGATLRPGQLLTLPPGAQDQGAARPAAPPLPAGVGGSPFLPSAPAQTVPALQPARPMPRVQDPSPAPAGGAAAVLPGAAAAVPSAAPLSPGTDWRGAAMALLGTPYVFGGESRSGTDCSGFVRQVFTPLGVPLPRVSADQAQAGVPVDDRDLRPGDLLFFDTEGRGRVSHVGIFLGDDQFVSANSYQGRVSVDRFRSDRYWGPRYLWARRVLDDPLALGRP